MKHLNLHILTIIACLSLLTNCSTRKDDNIEKLTIIEDKVTILPSETLEYRLGNIPTEGNVIIQRQAGHFQISEIKFDTLKGGLNYAYQPKGGFSGDDYVEIMRSGSIGNDNFVEKILLKLSITVVDNED